MKVSTGGRARSAGSGAPASSHSRVKPIIHAPHGGGASAVAPDVALARTEQVSAATQARRRQCYRAAAPPNPEPTAKRSPTRGARPCSPPPLDS